MEVLVVLFEFLVRRLRASSSVVVGEFSRNEAGSGGISGTEDLRLFVAPPLGGAGKNRVIFSSKVMLLVSLGSGLSGMPAVFGGGGRGGSCVGLPGLDWKMDLRLMMEPPDFERLCPLGDGSAG